MSELIPANEVVRILGIHQETLRKWENDGKILPDLIEGRKKFYDPDKVLALSESSIKFMVKSKDIQWLFDNDDYLRQNSICYNNPFVMRESDAKRIRCGEVVYESLPLISKQVNEIHVLNLQKEDYPGMPACVGVMVFGKKLNKLAMSGWGSMNGVVNSWSYRIYKDQIVQVLEEVWKFPHRPWRTEWVYLVVPDALLELTEISNDR